ncbi:MAG: hypothetical protein MSA21_08380 [Lachnospiraceae bacterium]|nr:hypothetical protein [Lachnospiraceae bacterium]
MENKDRIEKGYKLVDKIRNGVIKMDRRSNHGEEFYGAHEKQHSENFHDYLGSCVRYLSNKRMKEYKYHG